MDIGRSEQDLIKALLSNVQSLLRIRQARFSQSVFVEVDQLDEFPATRCRAGRQNVVASAYLANRLGSRQNLQPQILRDQELHIVEHKLVFSLPDPDTKFRFAV